MNLWLGTLSALIAAILAGLILKILIGKKRAKEIGNIKIEGSKIQKSKFGSDVESKKSETEPFDAGNIGINRSKLKETEIKSKVKIDE